MLAATVHVHVYTCKAREFLWQSEIDAYLFCLLYESPLQSVDLLDHLVGAGITALSGGTEIHTHA